MHKTISDPGGIQSRLIALVEIAHVVSGCSYRQLAREAGINKDMLARCLRGERQFDVSAVLGVVKAAGLPPVTSLTLALVCAREELELWLSSGAISFLDTLIVSMPGAIAVELGDTLGDLKSKWGIGAARLVGKRLAEHLAEAEHRDLALAMPRAGA